MTTLTNGFGGNVNCKYLVAYNGWDDEFDTDNGFSGKVNIVFQSVIRESQILLSLMVLSRIIVETPH